MGGGDKDWEGVIDREGSSRRVLVSMLVFEGTGKWVVGKTSRFRT